jgi:hypothetical protein
LGNALRTVCATAGHRGSPKAIADNASPDEQAEVLAAKRMIERSLERFDLYPSRLLGGGELICDSN